MIQAMTAYTYEIDDVAAAIAEIQGQLTACPLSKDMIGIVTCAYDFIESGVLAALADALPFQLVGETTVSQAVPGAAGLLMLTLMVLYADDCTFVGGITEVLPAGGDMSTIIAESYRATRAQLNAAEKLIIAFPPLLNQQSGDAYVAILSELSGHAPIFGSICADDSPGTYDNSHSIFGGAAYKDRLTYLLIAGNLSPQFQIASVSGKSRLPYRGEITASNANILMGINGLSTVGYLETIGLAEGGKIREGINSVPFLINFGDAAGQDDIPVARALFFTTEEQYGVCGGNMPIGASITVGVCDQDDVLSTTQALLEQIGQQAHGRPVLLFSCLGRRMALGGEPLREMQIAAAVMPAEMPFLCAYSSGEICPTSLAADRAVNRFHNYTFVACIL